MYCYVIIEIDRTGMFVQLHDIGYVVEHLAQDAAQIMENADQDGHMFMARMVEIK